jgi:hypothetical protein
VSWTLFELSSRKPDLRGTGRAGDDDSIGLARRCHSARVTGHNFPELIARRDRCGQVNGIQRPQVCSLDGEGTHCRPQCVTTGRRDRVNLEMATVDSTDNGRASDSRRGRLRTQRKRQNSPIRPISA